MRQLSEPVRMAPARTGRGRLALLAAASLVGPVVLLFETAAGKPIDATVVASVAGVMFLLVVLRMSGLVRVHQQAVEREQVVRQAALELVAAPGRAGIYEATLAAVRQVIAKHTEVLEVSLSLRNPDGTLGIVAHDGAGDPSSVQLSEWPPAVRGELTSGRAVSCSTTGAPASPPQPTDHVVLVPLTDNGVVTALITVGTAAEAPVDVANTLTTLAAQVTLALDREEVTELFHARPPGSPLVTWPNSWASQRGGLVAPRGSRGPGSIPGSQTDRKSATSGEQAPPSTA